MPMAEMGAMRLCRRPVIVRTSIHHKRRGDTFQIKGWMAGKPNRQRLLQKEGLPRRQRRSENFIQRIKSVVFEFVPQSALTPCLELDFLTPRRISLEDGIEALRRCSVQYAKCDFIVGLEGPIVKVA